MVLSIYFKDEMYKYLPPSTEMESNMNQMSTVRQVLPVSALLERLGTKSSSIEK